MYYTVFSFCLLLFFNSLSLSLSLINSRHHTSAQHSLSSKNLLSRYDPAPFDRHHLYLSLSLFTSQQNDPKSSNRTNVKSGVSALSSTSTAFGTAASNQRLESTGNGHIDEALRQQALAEEEAVMNQYKVTRLIICIEFKILAIKRFSPVPKFIILFCKDNGGMLF